ncbi:MAG: hypothetical protein AUI61_03000 [Thaumarchaeota archaeon 13_1_40CM_2_39_13_2]|nr:MAG: hypothetical protein AUI61_03000 [Thaumarchaeota archaeon 13_1_40CM_2_39_13_2]OLE40999.1 MAG: hypothetical protein AUG16_01710 [Thaumarchaeota archaeon 13_1_20CM_2_39_20]
MAKQITLDGWLLSHFEVLLKKGSAHITRTKTPIVLYRNMLEEEEGSYQETVCTLTDGYVIVQVITSGGGIVPSFQQQLVFTLDEFPGWLMRKSRDLLLHCVDLLEGQF